MPILPIDSKRYGSEEMRRIFDEESRFQRMLDVEAALAWAHAEVGNIPKKDAKVIMDKSSMDSVNLERIKKIESEIKHETMALAIALSEACGSSGAYVHLGATSNDILDTAMAIQIKEAIEIIEKRLDELERVLIKLSRKYAKTIMVGRTHGQHALPITLGFKFAVWMREVSRHVERLEQCSKRILVGKISGAVGSQAGFGPRAREIQGLVMRKLGLNEPEVTTQIVQRDRHAELICLFANIASSLDKFATEVRNLQRPEIGELAEPFEFEKQVGSSAMPHKQNPILCENTCSLAKLMRSLAFPALENVITWNERDLTQSASERFIIPEAFIILDQMLMNMIKVLSGIQVYESKMIENLELTKGLALSEAIMMALFKKGLGRKEAYELIRKLSLEASSKGKSFKELLLESSFIKNFIDEKELEEALNPKNYLGTILEQIETAIDKTIKERKARGLIE
ncbi:MAG: adenylosuccinate lyase [Candidatus Bathyarchaeia archaeon]